MGAVAGVGAGGGAGGAAAPGARRALERLIAEAYARSVIYELEGIERLRDTDPVRCAEKRVEGEIFLRIVSPWLQQRSAGASRTIARMLAGEPGAVNAAVARRTMASLLPSAP